MRFYCRHPGCKCSYLRKEHLRRHEAQHRGEQSSCPVCSRVFSRSDTLRRHIRQDHAEQEQIHVVRSTQACRQCRGAKVRCRGGYPCQHCELKQLECSFEKSRPDSKEKDDESPSGTQPAQPSILSRLGDADDIQRYVRIYFAHFHPQWPILHRATFSVDHEPALLLYAVVMIGLWAGGEDPNRQMALDLHRWLGTCIREQQTTWEDLSSQSDTLSSAWPIATYQGILLYLIFSLRIAPQEPRSFNLKIQLSAPDYQILIALVSTCRRHHVFSYPAMLGRYHSIESVTCIWVGVEEIKRFGLALYKVSRICCGASEVGEDRDQLLGLADLQFPAPDGNHLWEARSNPELIYLLAGIRRDGHLARSQSGRWISECDELLGGCGLE
ncbi:transcription factor with C2H2 and Zn(2)-Cys(6) DNA binding domain [Aspergillus steynii IBT 23096]|uniref:Transcription factor with C2H2 and Zn(2)-Cys(6) DNA binding domain n=1 Tax=Aspergillus steynii IBT 23096 TaxID=1392250 RepID=A0A2I2FSN1_9EURO|nr:transcription factor with C2H2 and Zn(2)-Cys(6) DNA binding domain [Aspergillus steynii IBT 23096]PLB43624.1 transcription factor with C2H2 and Zn(2)-Cys(6) DNA binding domain [Aspergillus steynii IBT 23096]